MDTTAQNRNGGEMATSRADTLGSVTRASQAVDTSAASLVAVRVPRRRLADLVLPEAVRRSCQEFLDDHYYAAALHAAGLIPRNRILLDGPPGNGKTSLAEALAEALRLPFYVVRYDLLIGGSLHETLTTLGQLFDQVQQQPCIVFFDEFDTIGKERGDASDTTDVKRAVGMLLIHIELTPPPTIVIAATNHQELLDTRPGGASICGYIYRARRCPRSCSGLLGYESSSRFLKNWCMNSVTGWWKSVSRNWRISVPISVAGR